MHTHNTLLKCAKLQTPFFVGLFLVCSDDVPSLSRPPECLRTVLSRSRSTFPRQNANGKVWRCRCCCLFILVAALNRVLSMSLAYGYFYVISIESNCMANVCGYEDAIAPKEPSGYSGVRERTKRQLNDRNERCGKKRDGCVTSMHMHTTQILEKWTEAHPKWEREQAKRKNWASAWNDRNGYVPGDKLPSP